MLHLYLTIVFLFSTGLSFTQELVPYLANQQYGYSDIEGHVKIEPKYDEVRWFDSDGLADVRKGNGWSKINRKGILLLPFESEKAVDLFPVFYSDTLISYYIHGKDTLQHLRLSEPYRDSYRIVNTLNGNYSQIFRGEFYSRSQVRKRDELLVTFFHGVLIGVASDSLYQLLDSDADVLLTSKTPLRLMNDHLVVGKENNQAMVYDFLKGEKNIFPYLEIHQVVKDSFFIVAVDAPPGTSRNTRFNETLKGLIDFNGKIILDVNSPGLSYLMGDLLIKYNKPGSSFFIDFNGNRIDTNTYNAIWEFDKKYYRVSVGERKWVLLDVHGKRITKEFEAISPLMGNYYTIKTGNMTSILDSNFNEVIRTEGEEMAWMRTPGLFHFRNNGKTGLIKASGEILVPAEYDQIHPWNDMPYISVQLDRKDGLLRSDGTLALEPVYESIGTSNNDQPRYIYTMNHRLYTLYDEHLNFIDDSLISPSLSRKVNLDRVGRLMHLRDPKGKLITAPVEKYKGGMVLSDTSWLHILYRDEYVEVINENGDIITDDSIRMDLDVNKRSFDAGLFGVKIGRKEGVINHKLKWILPLGSHEIIGVTQHLIITKKNGKYVLYTPTGQLLQHENYQDIDFDKREKFWRVRINGHYGFISSITGAVVIPAIYERSSEFYDYLTVVSMDDGGTGARYTSVIDTTGNIVLQTSYDSLYPLDEIESLRHYVVFQNGKKGVIDITGNIIIPIEYFHLEPYADTTFITSKDANGLSRLINRNNETFLYGDQFPQNDNYIQLPGRRYLLRMKDHSLIVDHLGRPVKTLQNTEFKKIPSASDDFQFLEVTVNGYQYLINAETLVEYRGGM